MNHDLLDDSAWRGPLMLAMQRAIVAEFNATDWHELGYLTGFHDYIQGHARLLRSLGFGDDDYGACVFQALQFFANNDTRALIAVIEHPKIRPQLESVQADKLIELGYQVGRVPAVLPPATASDVVRRALTDADNLLATSGAPSAIDRLHTALHGYLKSACRDSAIALADDATLTQAYKALRAQHPVLRSMGAHDNEIGKILASFASVLDALNTLRNHGSVAHPNENLLDAAEGALVLNAVRTIFHYLNRKLGQ
ncbi:abortive infection family protein [Burkholderia cenocepacia]|uniref:abortive infection family protein n=1 Tax=Burkholderia cenocepacia TaxID=95486 RepID=UPI0005A0060E|nr:abortive infection family protein [Burkholderia cenocepacia]MBR8171600.1 abortive infection family protein [Burkholderia cenocepacia]